MKKNIIIPLLALITILLAFLTLASILTQFTDNFERADSTTVGNNWFEIETAPENVNVTDNTLQMDTSVEGAYQQLNLLNYSHYIFNYTVNNASHRVCVAGNTTMMNDSTEGCWSAVKNGAGFRVYAPLRFFAYCHSVIVVNNANIGNQQGNYSHELIRNDTHTNWQISKNDALLFNVTCDFNSTEEDNIFVDDKFTVGLASGGADIEPFTIVDNVTVSSVIPAADTPPTFTQVVNNATAATRPGNTVNWSTTITAENGLSFCWFAQNDTGTFVNTTLITCSSPRIMNENITVSGSELQQICGFFGANDTLNNHAQTANSCFTLTDFTPPVGANPSNNASTPIVNEVVQWRINLTDTSLATWTFGFNNSGSFVNDSTTDVTGQKAVNVFVNKSVTTTPNVLVCGRFYFNDSAQLEAQAESCFTTLTIHKVNLTIKDFLNNVTLNDVNTTVRDRDNLSFLIAERSTSNGLTQFNLKPGNYSFNISAIGHSLFSRNSKVNATQNLTFFAQNASTIFVTIRDEITKVLLNDTTVEVFSDTFTGNFSVNGTALLESIPSGSYTIRYNKDLYRQRLFFVDIPTQGSANVILNLLTDGNSSTFNNNVKDENFKNLEGVIIQALRFYPDTNIFEVVEMSRTDFDGNAELHLQKEVEFYKYILLVNGEVKIETDPAYVTDLIIANGLNFNVNLQSNALEIFQSLNKVSAGVFFTNETNNFRFTYADTTGEVKEACLTVSKVTALGIIRINQSCTQTSSATILIPISRVNASYTACGTLSIDSTNGTAADHLVDCISFSTLSNVQIFGFQTVFYMVTVMLMLGMSFLVNPKISIVTTSLSFLIIAATGFTVLSWTSVSGVVAVGLFMAYRMKSKED